MTGLQPSRRDLGRLALGAAALSIGIVPAVKADVAPFTVVDALGRTVRFQATPRRVVALGHAPFSQLAALQVRPVGAFANPGFTALTDYLFPDPASIPSVVNIDWSPDAEIMARLRPDLVLGWGFNEAQMVEGLAPFLAIREFTSIADVTGNLRMLGTVLDASAAAEQAIMLFEARRLAYRRRTARKGSLLFVSGRDTKRVSVASQANVICQLADDVSDCVAHSPAARSPYVDMSLEGLLAIDPDSIVLGYFQVARRPAYLAALARTPIWKELRAVKTGRVILYDGYQDLSIRGLPTAARLLDLIVPKLQPERVPRALDDSELITGARG